MDAASSVGSAQVAGSTPPAQRNMAQSRGASCKWSGRSVNTDGIPVSQIRVKFVSMQLGHWARECNQRKKPAAESTEVNGISCLLPMSTSPPKSMVSPFIVFCTVVAKGV